MKGMSESDTAVLAELAFMLRAIARKRRCAGPLLRDMANAYDIRARETGGRR